MLSTCRLLPIHFFLHRLASPLKGSGKFGLQRYQLFSSFIDSSRNMDFKKGDGYGGHGLHVDPPKHHYTVIFMHGLGDTGDGWADFIALLRRRRGVFDETKFILPTAPTREISLIRVLCKQNGGFPMPAWANIMGLTPSDPEDEAGYNESITRIKKIVDAEVQKGIPSTHIVLGGFSQGGATAYLTALSYPKTLGGIIAFSAWLPLMKQNPTRFATIPELTLKTPVLHCHGTGDPMVELKWGKATIEELKSMGMKTELKTYPGMGHSACDEELLEAAVFMEKTFSKRVEN